MSDSVDALGAFLRHDFATYEQLTASADPKAIGVMFSAAAFVAVDEYFSGEPAPGVSDVLKFVADVRAQFDSTGDDLDPLTAERFIRAIVFENEGLIDGLDGGAIGRVQPAIIATITYGWEEARINQFLSEVRADLAERGER